MSRSRKAHAGGGGFSAANRSFKTLTFNVSHLLRRNVRWVVEYTHDLNGDLHRFFTGLTTAF